MTARRPLLAAVSLLVVPALALAGKTVTEGNNTLQIKAAFDPAKASESKKKRRPIESRYDYVAGTTNDKRLPDLRSVKVFLDGAKFAFDAFPTCDETDAATEGDAVCAKGSRVGGGTGIAEIHPPDDPNTKTDLEVDVTLYNGDLDTDREGQPLSPTRQGLLVYTEVAGTRVVLPFLAERRNRQVTLYNPEEDADPGSEGLYAIKEIHLTIARRTIRRDGRRIAFLGAPVVCDRSWTVTTTNEPYTGQPIMARHKVRCTDA